MAIYRLYPVTQAGRISSPPLIVDCPNDAVALGVMNASEHPFGIEMWDDLRHVGSRPAR